MKKFENYDEYVEVVDSLRKDYKRVLKRFNDYPAIVENNKEKDYCFKALCLELGVVETRLIGINLEMKELSKQVKLNKEDIELNKLEKLTKVANELKQKIRKLVNVQ